MVPFFFSGARGRQQHVLDRTERQAAAHIVSVNEAVEMGDAVVVVTMVPLLKHPTNANGSVAPRGSAERRKKLGSAAEEKSRPRARAWPDVHVHLCFPG